MLPDRRDPENTTLLRFYAYFEAKRQATGMPPTSLVSLKIYQHSFIFYPLKETLLQAVLEVGCALIQIETRFTQINFGLR